MEKSEWCYKTVGPFSVPNYAEGAYSVLLTLDFFNKYKMTTLRTTPLLSFSAVTSESTFLTALNLAVNVAERQTTVFNNATRVEVYNFIKTNPGIQFRGICNQLGICIGVAEFHLGVLKKAGLILSFHDGKYKRFFEDDL